MLNKTSYDYEIPVYTFSDIAHGFTFLFFALTLLVGHQEEHLACKN